MRRPHQRLATSAPLVGLQPLFRILAAFIALGFCSCRNDHPSPDHATPPPLQVRSGLDSSLVVRLAALNEQLRADFGDTILPPSSAIFATIESLSLTLSSRISGETNPDRIIQAANRLIFHDRGVTFEQGLDDPAGLFPHSVLVRRKGSCVGISLLYLCMGENLGLPFHGVLVPKHFFTRFGDGDSSVNIESMKAGDHRSNQWYRQRFNIPEGSWHDLRNLTGGQVMAVVRFNVANYYRDHSLPGKAVRLYRDCVAVLPGFAEAWGNMAIALENMGQHEMALVSLERARALDPGLRNVSRNLGALYIRQKRFDEAAARYQAGLEHEPDDPDLLYGLGVALFYLGKKDRAAEYAKQALSRRPSFPEALKLLSQASGKRGR